jgi:hypothetical protein
MPRLPPNGPVACQPYTIIGYLDLWQIHSVFEHVTADTTDEAIKTVHDKLIRTNAEYDASCAEGLQPLTVIAVFSGHLNEND